MQIAFLCFWCVVVGKQTPLYVSNSIICYLVFVSEDVCNRIRTYFVESFVHQSCFYLFHDIMQVAPNERHMDKAIQYSHASLFLLEMI